VQGAVQAEPSIVKPRPAGEVVTVLDTSAPKLALTETGAVMVAFCGVTVPLSPPLNPVNWNPALACAPTETTEPELYQPLTGVMLPPLPAVVVR
jgi:hypothetical protein